MPRPVAEAEIPQISVLSWLLGGKLIGVPPTLQQRRRTSNPAAVVVAKDKPKEERLKQQRKCKKCGKYKTGENKCEHKSDATTTTAEVNKAEVPKVEAAKEEEKKTEPAATTSDPAPSAPAPAPAAEAEAEAAPATAPEDTTSAWTAAQDSQILTLKASNTSWKEIATAVGSTKAQVIARYKEIKDEPVKSDEKGKGKADENAPSAIESGAAPPATNATESKGLNVAPTNTTSNAPQAESQSAPQRLTPDEVWTRDDCEMLEMLETRYREQKWLQIQAGLYNLTGRMVAAEIIRLKFGVS